MHRLFALSAFMLLLETVTALAEPQPFRVSGLPWGGSLTIREAPDADAAPVETIPVGRRLLGFGCTNETPSGNTWCRVKFGFAVGWARRRYLSPD
ncbi:SH3 domain-containing protein [Methylobacterium sp. C25]|uniref:SH3 domain-containing protein n=1 Tax=Methylobacterium sp. C25 TaxID=2721622 RepID=UPI003FA3965B|nr:SH3 domain-containing protein [Methylobacterium sp. C25]